MLEELQKKFMSRLGYGSLQRTGLVFNEEPDKVYVYEYTECSKPLLVPWDMALDHNYNNTSASLADATYSESLKYILTGRCRTDENKKKFGVFYYDWLLNRSPWASYYITKDPEKAWDLGIAVDPDKQYQLVASATIATRAAYEKDLSRNFYHLVKSGMNEGLAHLISMHIFINGNSFCHRGITHTHCAVYAIYFDSDYINNFINGTIVNIKSDETYSQKMTYEHINTIWGNPPQNAENNVTNKIRDYKTPSNGKRKTNTNPFITSGVTNYDMKHMPHFVEYIEGIYLNENK